MSTLDKSVENVVLVSVCRQGQSDAQTLEYLDELEFLAHTAGGKTLKRFIQKLEYPDPRTYVGKGKLEEITSFVKLNEVSIMIFDDELTPSQLRNIEKLVGCKVYLEKQRGGIGMRGPGETEIETDRRVIRDKLSKLKEKLREIDKQNLTRRKSRENIVRVALVGYTNVGKSTIMNLLSKSDVFAENKLFATLDTTVRKVVYGSIPFLLSDTVGFIRKLPHNLVESFKSTLDEVREADILLHVVDVSHPNFEDQIDVVNQTLADIGAADKKVLMVFNKLDAYRYVEKDADDLTPASKENVPLEELKRTWMAKVHGACVFISAAKGINIAELREKLTLMVGEKHQMLYPQNRTTD